MEVIKCLVVLLTSLNSKVQQSNRQCMASQRPNFFKGNDDKTLSYNGKHFFVAFIFSTAQSMTAESY